MSPLDVIECYHQWLQEGGGHFPDRLLQRLVSSLQCGGGKLVRGNEVLAHQGPGDGEVRWYTLPGGEKLSLALVGGTEAPADLLLAAGAVLTAWVCREELRQARLRERRRLWEVEGLRALAENLGGSLDWQAAAQSALFHSMALLDARSGEVWLSPDVRWPGSPLVREASGFSLAARMGGEVLSPVQAASLPPEGLATAKAVAVPIRSRDRLLGALALADREVRGGVAPFTERDRETLWLLAIQTGLALEAILAMGARLDQERLEQELALAASVQRHLIPALPSKILGWELASFFAPSRRVGGDLYDLVATPHGMVLALFDVAGKGLPAALLAASLQGALRVIASQTRDLVALSTVLDRHVGGLWAAHQFATAFFCQLGEKGRVRFLGAGHLPAVVVGHKDLRFLSSQGPPLGLLSEAHFTQGETHLVEGETAILFTDGLVEAENSQGEALGLESLARAAWEARGLPLAEMVGHLVSQVEVHAGPSQSHDDRTLIAFRLTNSATPIMACP